MFDMSKPLIMMLAQPDLGLKNPISKTARPDLKSKSWTSQTPPKFKVFHLQDLVQYHTCTVRSSGKKWSSRLWLSRQRSMVTPLFPNPLLLSDKISVPDSGRGQEQTTPTYVNMYFNKSYRYRCSHSLLESKGFLVMAAERQA